MKTLYAGLIALILATSPALAKDNDTTSIYPLIKGSYAVLGMEGNESKTYSGTAEITTEPTLKITRTVNGITSVGTVVIDKGEGAHMILNITFDGKDPETKQGRYSLFIDDQNYPTLSGIVMKSLNEEVASRQEVLLYKNEPFE